MAWPETAAAAVGAVVGAAGYVQLHSYLSILLLPPHFFFVLSLVSVRLASSSTACVLVCVCIFIVYIIDEYADNKSQSNVKKVTGRRA